MVLWRMFNRFETKLLGCELNVTGRIINDGQGAMILCDGATFSTTDTGLKATELRAQWGLQ